MNNKLNPYFEVEGKTYEIKRTRALECEYEKISKQIGLSDDEEKYLLGLRKLQADYSDLNEKFEEAKEDFFANVTNKEKKEIYLAFKELVDEKYNEVTEFLFKHKDYQKLEDQSYEIGKKTLYVALEQQYKLTTQQAVVIWDKFEDHLGLTISKQWIATMIQTLFNDDEEEEKDPFLKQAQAKAKLKMEQRKGLSKIKK